jgi:hypothetical protein
VTTTEETATETPPQTVTMKRCFSGSGKFANRKWAPGGDASYLSRLRKAHLADQTLPDPWYIQEHGGIEDKDVPEDGWPQLSAMDIASRLDQERGGGVESHWVHTLEQASEKARTKEAAKSTRTATQRKTKEERDAERARQAQRPKKNSKVKRLSGEFEGQEATVLRAISPTQLLIRYEGGMEELVTDEDVERIDPPAADAEAEQAGGEQPEGEFAEE